MEESKNHSLTDRQRYWLEHIRICEASGKSIAEYAAEQGLAARAMYGGKKALVKKGVLPRARVYGSGLVLCLSLYTRFLSGHGVGVLT